MKDKKLINAHNWKHLARWHGDGYYELRTEDIPDVPVRLFLTPKLLSEAEEILYRQIVNASRFPGARLVAITPDVHYGYGVPVGCVLLTNAESGAVAMGPVGYDISCGMVSARSDVPVEAANPDLRLRFNREVMERVDMGAGGKSIKLGRVDKQQFQNLIRGGAEYYVEEYGASFDRSRAERHRMPVDDDWQVPWGGRGKPERGLEQLGSLGGGKRLPPSYSNIAATNSCISGKSEMTIPREGFNTPVESIGTWASHVDEDVLRSAPNRKAQSWAETTQPSRSCSFEI